jgi:serine/threonine protein kinase
VGERQFGPYRLVRQVAVGGMAEIHLAKTNGIAGFEKYVALKMIHPNFAADDQFIQMLVDEAKIAVQLNHGNIAQTFDLGRVGDTYYITMEFVDGADLYKILRRGSEKDVEIPLDVCAFVAKEVTSALDYAHRKRDHTGKTLGIVHRDVSPQNVLISYAGEVKLVDFGIAKATMKARQTAVGVIKGKYYYMSPEQAWGDQVDYRSDIFSAGIVLYEMIVGQMLYLEEDLQKLIEMARKADIAPPSTLRKGVPPQLESIVMRALARDRRERYQSAGDFATDLERFLHTYSPVFTAAKVAGHLKSIIGPPVELPEDVEVRDGPSSTHALSTQDLVLDKEELKDENSVIFRVADLRPKKPAVRTRDPHDSAGLSAPTTLERKQRPGTESAGARVTRQANFDDIVQATDAEVPSFPKPRQPTPPAGARKVSSPSASGLARVTRQANFDDIVQATDAEVASFAKQRPPTPASGVRPRVFGEDTRQVPAAPGTEPSDDSGLHGVTAARAMLADSDPLGGVTNARVTGNTEDSGLLGGVTTASPKSAAAWRTRDKESTQPGAQSADSGGDHTVISDEPMSAFGGDTGEDGGDATVFSTSPAGEETNPDLANPDHDDSATHASLAAIDPDTEDSPLSGDDGPTSQHDFRERATPKAAAPRSAITPAPPALAANIHAPAVSELRKPRASRRTPGAGTPTPVPNVLQAIVSKNPAEPMPVPVQRPGAMRIDVSGAPAKPMQAPGQTANRTLLGTSNTGPSNAPSSGTYPQAPPGLAQSYGHIPSTPYPQTQPPGPPQMTPGAFYQANPYGAPPPQPMTLTGQLRLMETDEIGDRYKLSGGRGAKIVIAGLASVSVAAAVTFIVIKLTREAPPSVGEIRVESTPAGAQVVFDGQRLIDATPMTISSVPTGTRHEIRLELPRHQAHTETVDIPKSGGEVTVSPTLDPVTGKVRVVTQPDGAEIRIDGVSKGYAPRTIEGIDIATARKLELRLKDHEPIEIELTWPDNGEININQKLNVRP